MTLDEFYEKLRKTAKHHPFHLKKGHYNPGLIRTEIDEEEACSITGTYYHHLNVWVDVCNVDKAAEHLGLSPRDLELIIFASDQESHATITDEELGICRKTLLECCGLA